MLEDIPKSQRQTDLGFIYALNDFLLIIAKDVLCSPHRSPRRTSSRSATDLQES